MKKYIALLTIFTFYCAAQSAYAAASISPDPTASGTQSAMDKQITELKEKITTHVKELKLVEKQGVLGTVSDVTGTTKLSLTDLQGNTQDVDIDELTKFSNPDSKGTFGISDIQKGSVISVLGLYNKESKHILARFITSETLPKLYNGAITSIDKKNFTLYIATAKEKAVFIDHENNTRDFTYSAQDGLMKGGFSKMTVGERIYVIGTPDIKDKTKIVASRIIVFPDLQPNPKVAVPTSATTPATSPTQTPSPTPLTKKRY